MKFYTGVGIHNLITCANFGHNQLRGLGMASGQIQATPLT